MNPSRANKFYDKTTYDEIVIGQPYELAEKKQVLKKINKGSGMAAGRISVDASNNLSNSKESTIFHINKLNLNNQDLKSKYNDVTDIPNKEKNQVIINKMMPNRLSINTDLYQEAACQSNLPA